MNKIIAGSIIKIEAEAACPKRVPLTPVGKKFMIATEAGLTREPVSTSAKKNSLIHITKVYIVHATIPGLTSGRLILKKEPMSEVPSTKAASSNSLGISSKKLRINQTAKGKLKAMKTKMIPR